MPKIYARRKGFLIVIDDIARSQIDETVDWLLAHDFMPDPPAGDPWLKTPSGLPICTKHNTEMRQRQKQNDTWFSHKIIDQTTGQERFCKGFRNPSNPSDGFDL